MVHDHCALSFLEDCRSAFSASFTSSKVSSPDSTRCAITSLARPPNTASSSSTKRRCASLREITASKMLALLIRFTRIATGKATIEEVGWDIFHFLLDVASGRKKTWAEHWGLA